MAGDSAGRYARLMGPAVRQVRRALPNWRGPLLVEVPSSGKQLDSALQAEPGEYANIAAVTTTVDGSLSSDAPVRVFVNPTVFGRLKERGAQVVMSHEATHVATGATFATMPTWLQEGFADFVALDGAGVPVGARRSADPRPDPQGGAAPDGSRPRADLDPSANGLGATYEEAWLACRFMSQKYGADRLRPVLPRGERRRIDAGGVPQRVGHHAAEVRGAVARGPRPPCRGGTLRT